MIWYDNEFKLDGQPSSINIRMTGSYNPGSMFPLIMLQLSIIESKVLQEVNLYSHNPSMMRQQNDPDPEDVFARYSHKVQKFAAKISSMDYSEFIAWCDTRKNTV